jgi:hypothetical protein
MRRLLADVAQLLARDLANAEAGHYPLPEDRDGTLAELIARSRAFFRDVPEVLNRKESDNGREVAETAAVASGRTTTCRTSTSSRAAG